MRILSVSNVPLQPHLGSGYVIQKYVEELRTRGHEVTTLDPGGYEWLPQLRAGKRLRTVGGYAQATLRALRREVFDVVELWGAEAWWVARRLAWHTGRPLVVGRSNGLETHFAAELARHGLAPRAGWPGRMFDRWQQPEAAFRCVDLLTTVSQFDRRHALAQGYQPEEKLLTLENPLRDELLGRVCVAERPSVIGFFGGVLPNKGAGLLAEALSDVLRNNPRWRARFVGIENAGFRERLPADVATRVETIPFVRERARLEALYEQTAIVAMPSAYESFGLVGAEAMACGCALVASRTGFAADLRHEHEAVVVAERTPEAWRTALAGLVADEERRRRIARGGHARVQALRWSDATDRLLQAYGRCVPTERARANPA